MSTPPPTCSECGGALPAGALGGLCPRCVARAFSRPPNVESGASVQKTDSAQREPASERKLPELRKSEFLVEQELGRGGMGLVYEAQDPNLGRRVVVKFLRPERETQPAAVDRFLAEARITGQLEHPGIVPVYQLGVDPDKRPFYAMRQVQGETLGAVLDRLRQQDAPTVARYPLAALLNVFQKTCDAVAYAHSRGVVHRDLKPGNVMIGAFGEVVVMDWGLAKVLSAEPSTGISRPPIEDTHSAATVSSSSSSSSLVLEPGSQEESRTRTKDEDEDEASQKPDHARTLDDTILGTPGFMAPEQAEGHSKQADERADVYSLGAILYAILTLQPPVRGRDAHSILKRTKSGSIRPPTNYNPGAADLAASVPLPHCPNRRIPASLSAVAMKALAVRPEHRYQNVLDLQEDVTAYQNGLPTAAEQAGRWVRADYWIKRHRTATAVVLLIALLVAGFSWRNWRTLVELRNTAPSLIALAESLVTAQKFPEALERVEVALRLHPENANYQNLKGDVLLALLRIAEARDAYGQALRLDASLSAAPQKLALCEELLSDRRGQSEWTLEHLLELYHACLQQGLSAQAYAISRHLGAADARFIEMLQARLTAAGITNRLERVWHRPSGLRARQAGLTNTFQPGGSKYLALDLEQSELADLSLLQGMPLQELNLGVCRNVSDLTPLRGMPLVRLTFSFGDVADLSPLSGMPLESLYFNFNKVRDLGPLRTIPTLRSLNFHNVDVSDLGPLKGLPLETLIFMSVRVTSLEALRGMPLTSLGFAHVNVTDLGPLADLSLQELRVQFVDVSDVSPLRGLPLRVLHLGDCPLITDLSPLKECKTLEELVLPPNAQAIEFLHDFPHLRKISYTENLLPAAEFWLSYDARKNYRK